MPTINGSVGQNGRNTPKDVKTVQRLLNEHRKAPLRQLEEDGISGPATIKAIRHFQSENAGMKNPDGRVDPGGRTFSKLKAGEPPAKPETTPAKETPETRRENRKKRHDFVRPQVKEIAVTTKIIDGIQPHFEGVQARVISGYLNDSDRFWKINYHWEYLIWMIDHSMTLEVSEQGKKALSTLKSRLLMNMPQPDSGYRTSAAVGKPQDRSSLDDFNQRFKVVRQSKRDFKKIFQTADLKTKSSRTPKTFDLAAAPVAHPGTSKHGTGYSLDIAGKNGQIKSICKNLGATVTFNEQSHVHVEFKNGVNQPS